MRVQSWSIDKPSPYGRNPRKISDKAVDKVAASIKEFGFRQPIVVDENGIIIVGHARLLAAQRLGLKKVPVHVAEGLSEVQARAYRLADNRTGEEASWDAELLTFELAELDGFDLELTGFDPAELSALVPPTEGDTGEDEAPGLPDTPISRPGDVWACGGHRLLCGDATSADDVARLLNGTKPNLMVTDPPYGVEYDPDWRNKANLEVLGKRSIGSFVGKTKTGVVKQDGNAEWSAAWLLFPGAVAYVWHAYTKTVIVAESLAAADLLVRSQIIWAKQNFVISRGHYHVQHEPCWYAVRKGQAANWCGGRKQSTVWQVANRAAMGGQQDDASTNHSTQKPVEVMRRPIANHTRKGDAVYDPFVGSGTTIIAAETIGRICYAIDIDPIYVDVAVQRWQAFSGKDATLEDGGRTFDQIGAMRKAA